MKILIISLLSLCSINLFANFSYCGTIKSLNAPLTFSHYTITYTDEKRIRFENDSPNEKEMAQMIREAFIGRIPICLNSKIDLYRATFNRDEENILDLTTLFDSDIRAAKMSVSFEIK